MRAYILSTERMTASPIYNFGRASFEMTGEFVFFPQGEGECGIKKGLFIQIESKEDIGGTFHLHFLPRVFESQLLFSEKGMKSLKEIEVSEDIYGLAKKILEHEIRMAELFENNSAISESRGNKRRFIDAIKQEENEYRYKQIIESEKKKGGKNEQNA